MRAKVLGEGQSGPTAETVQHVAEALSLLDEADELMADRNRSRRGEELGSRPTGKVGFDG
jgi:hypothetical protein